MKRLEEVKDFIKNNCLVNGKIQTFFTRNLAGDELSTLYDKNGIQIDYCFDYEYIEVFYLNNEEKEELMNTDFCY